MNKPNEPNRIWVYRDQFHYPCMTGTPHPVRPSVEYVRADLVSGAVEKALADLKQTLGLE